MQCKRNWVTVFTSIQPSQDSCHIPFSQTPSPTDFDRFTCIPLKWYNISVFFFCISIKNIKYLHKTSIYIFSRRATMRLNDDSWSFFESRIFYRLKKNATKMESVCLPQNRKMTADSDYYYQKHKFGACHLLVPSLCVFRETVVAIFDGAYFFHYL